MAIILACGGSPNAPNSGQTFAFDFSVGQQGWIAGFAEYPSNNAAFYDLVADYRPLSPPLVASRSALFISGNNHSDDLFMFYKRQITGLRPAVSYSVSFDKVQIATDVPRGCGGAGGAPGESVFLKAGAARVEPVTTTDNSGYVRLLNIDKGNQSMGGHDAIVLGTIENSLPCAVSNGQLNREWQLKTLHSNAGTIVQADDQGAVWLIVGTDSGFEGTTAIYYTAIEATFSPT